MHSLAHPVIFVHSKYQKKRQSVELAKEREYLYNRLFDQGYQNNQLFMQSINI
jgi:hypothetical protein